MKLVKHEAPVVLHEGDQVTVTVTHHLTINGDDSWVKYEAGSRLQPGESAEDIDERLMRHATQAVVQLAVRTAQQVQLQSGGN